MALPRLYKFLDIQGAKLTLGNGTFKHAKPSDFNDSEDLTIQSIFPVDIEEALLKIQQNFTGVILRHLHDEPTCTSPMKEQLQLIQRIYKENPLAAQLASKELAHHEDNIFDLEYFRSHCAAFQKEINDFMQGYRVLCVTTDINSTRMWDEYAQAHTGVAVRIQANLAKDSKFRLFREVTYQDSRPALYDDPTEFLSLALFGNKDEYMPFMIEKIIYTKTTNRVHENEYRLAVPLLQHEEPWDIDHYHDEEITELFLGANMSNPDIDNIINIAKRRNPEILIYQGRLDHDKTVLFDRLC